MVHAVSAARRFGGSWEDYIEIEEWLDEIIVLVIDTENLEYNLFDIDQNVLDNEGDTIEYHGVISPQFIKLYN